MRRPKTLPFAKVPKEIKIGQLGAVLITPGMTQSEIDVTDAAIWALARDISESSKANDAFRKAYGDFARGWVEFKKRNESWWNRGYFGVYEQVQDYKVRTNQWREKFSSIGGKTTAPVLKEKKGVDWRRAAIVAGGLGAVLYLIIREVKS